MLIELERVLHDSHAVVVSEAVVARADGTRAPRVQALEGLAAALKLAMIFVAQVRRL